jgi:hypothetical protein
MSLTERKFIDKNNRVIILSAWFQSPSGVWDEFLGRIGPELRAEVFPNDELQVDGFSS